MNSSIPCNMPRFLRELEEKWDPHRPLIRYLDGTQVLEVPAVVFWAQVCRCASTLYQRQLSGKHVGLMGANRLQWLVHFCALFQIGAVAVLFAPELNSAELAARADLSDTSCILYDASLQSIVTASGCPGYSMDEPFSDTQTSFPACNPAENTLACILFTSGTTSAGKAVMLSQKAMVAGSCHHVVRCTFQAQLAILPMHHVAGFATVLNTWYLGSVLCLGEHPGYLFRYLQLLQPDYMLAVPAIVQAMIPKLKHGGIHGNALGWNLKFIGCGGAKFPPNVIKVLNDHQIRILQNYGATEAGGLGLEWEMTPQCQDTIGKPSPDVEIKIHQGELFLRCASMMMGYYKDPEGTARVMHDGWYATGDLCVQDEQGYLHLTGRKRNLIILSNGENVSPEEIEHQLCSCDAIQEIMVGLENQLITATIYPAASYQDAIAQIHRALDLYNRSVPPYKQIQNLHITDAPFAKTSLGKIIRRSVTEGGSHDNS